MLRCFPLALLCIAVQLVAICAESAPQRAEVLLVGDSLAVGLDAPLRALERERGVVLRTEAVVGTSALYWRPRLRAILAAYKPRRLLVSLGTNDATASDRKRVVEAFRGICDEASAAGVPLAWVAPLPMPPRLRDGLAVVRDAFACALAIDVDAAAVERARDGIHATAAGYATWARLLAARLGEP